jgi:hypothetical protein
VSTPEERDRLARALEERRLVPDRATQMRIRADATRLARDACHLQGQEAARSVQAEAMYRRLELLAKRWPPDDE